MRRHQPEKIAESSETPVQARKTTAQATAKSAPQKTATSKATAKSAPQKTATSKAAAKSAPQKKATSKTAAKSAPKKTATSKTAAKSAPQKTAISKTAAKSPPKERAPKETTAKKSTPAKKIPPKQALKKSAWKKSPETKPVVKKPAPLPLPTPGTPTKLPHWEPGWLWVMGARQNNLRSIDVPFPLSAMTIVTGVSGSGKSSLVSDILYPALARVLCRAQDQPGAFDKIVGMEALNKAIAVDQQPIGQTPTSNPATYTGVFDLIRQLYARLPEAKMRGYTPRRFSFNVPGGRCEKCEGAGQLKIEMHFLADVWIPCDACDGKRYDSQTLEVKFRGKSIADVLEMSCAEALVLFAKIPGISRILRTLCDVGLDYLALGQSATTLSGGEAQRVKLAAELSRPDTGRTLYVLDEPTTGLHFEDLRKLLEVLQRLVDLGNTVVLIEHNLDMIKAGDWVVELGPEAGFDGGNLVFAGTPEELVDYEDRRLALPEEKRASYPKSWTAEALRPVLATDPHEFRKMFDAAKYQAELERLQSTDWEEEIDREVPMPWASDGRSWHTRDRRSRTGTTCKWDGEILGAVIDKIEESDVFAETDWNNRSIVEVRSRKKTTGWFFHAITGEEWLLKMKFRVPKNSFKKEELIAALDLRPLNEMDDIPLYGTQTRTRVETTGPWQEVELRVCKKEETDKPSFWKFIDDAIAAFGRLADRADEREIDLTPWKTLGERWHFRPDGFYGGSRKPLWPMELLEKVVASIRRVAPTGTRAVWTNKMIVPFYFPDSEDYATLQLYTKNCDFVCVQLNVPKNSVPLGQILPIGSDPEVDGSRPDYDAVYLRFRTEKEFDAAKFESLLRGK